MAGLFEDLKNEGKRLAIQGSMELSSALFNGHAFVPYGPGQYTPSPSQETDVKARESVEPQREAEGRSR